LVEDPHLMDMELLNACVDNIDPPSCALYNMQFKLNEMGVDHNSVYEEIAMPSDHECGHIDGSSMATTTNKLEFLHHYVEYSKTYSKSHWPCLAVADKFPYFPSGEGYLKVPLRVALAFACTCVSTP
jgi:hypothetical protein